MRKTRVWKPLERLSAWDVSSPSQPPLKSGQAAGGDSQRCRRELPWILDFQPWLDQAWVFFVPYLVPSLVNPLLSRVLSCDLNLPKLITPPHSPPYFENKRSLGHLLPISRASPHPPEEIPISLSFVPSLCSLPSPMYALSQPHINGWGSHSCFHYLLNS